jgi:hypothetical protein
MAIPALAYPLVAAPAKVLGSADALDSDAVVVADASVVATTGPVVRAAGTERVVVTIGWEYETDDELALENAGLGLASAFRSSRLTSVDFGLRTLGTLA